MTSRVILIILSLVFNLSVFAQVSISTNKQSCRFEVGEQINFLVTSNQSGNATYTLQYDKYNPIQTGTVYLQAGVAKTISYTANEPTVINCLVNHNGNVGVSSAAVSPFQIQMIEDEPQDFDAFWAGKKAELAAVPIDPQLNYHSNTAYSTTYRINLGQIDNRRIYGYITIPNGGGYYPAVITLPPYGTGTGLTVVEPTFAEQSNTISMSISIHNVEPNQIDNNAYTPNYFLDKDQNYYRYGVLAGIRAIDYLYTRSDVDQSKIGLFGNSQGGGLSMLVAGIDNRVKVCMLTISAFCMHEGYKYGRGSGFPYFLQAATGPPYPQEETLQNVKYYDAVYAAARFKGPVLMSVSYLDDTTAPVSNFAAWNQFTGSNKVMIHSTRLGHVSPSRMWEDRFKLLRRVWPNATANPLWPYGDTTSKGHWVNAGSNINGQANAPINLNGTVEFNEGTNYSWPVSWEKVSGPGNVNFSNANNRSTSATFSSNGTYVLRFRSEDQQTYAGENNFITMEDFVQVTIGGSGSNQQNQTISFNSIPDKLTTDNAFNISATASSGLPVSFSIASGPATISGNTITLTGQEGTVIVRANQIGNINYYPAAQQTQSFLVTAPDTGGGGGGGTCTSTTLLSQNKPANQSSTFSTSGVSGDAYKAVDGNTNGNFWGGSVAACTNSYQPYWQVDLGTSYNIEQIKIWNRTEGNDRLNDFYVMISDNPFSNNLNTAINSSSWSQFTSGQAGTPSNFNLNSSGRYVRIQANGNSYLTIAEVQVYGCNGDGGDNNNCQDSDNDGTCDEDDCFIWNPNLPATPGTPCDDYDPHNFNDVYLADGCTCKGSGSSLGGGGNPVASCSSNGNSTSYEYIEKVKIGSINNLSGNNYGYKNYEYLTTSAAPGEALLLNLIPGFTGSTQTLYWRVWIDFNNDGDFWDYGEYFYQESSNTSLFDYVTIPNNVTAESIKLRVAMKAGSWPEPCESFAYGEVEDYTINITQTSAPRITNNKQVESKFDFTLRPNPVDDFVISEFINKDAGQKITAFNLYNTLGEKIDVETLDYRIEEDQLVLFTNSLKAGYYLLSIATMDQMVTKPFIKIE